MNKNGFLFGAACLMVGLVIGFFAANAINRNQIAQSNPTQKAPLQDAQVPNILVKDQPARNGAMLPDVSVVIDKANNEPNNFEAQTKAGDMYAKIQRFDKAVESYEQANRIDPNDYETIVKIGNSYFDSREFETAQKWYERALAKKPNDINVRTDLGITFVEREKPDLDRAVKEFQTSLETNPRHEPTLYNLGIAYLKKENFEETQQVLRQLEDVNPQGQLLQRLKQILASK
jgi:tetratricopeptide (TPR) repeat protein